jgi:hypothetical protein
MQPVELETGVWSGRGVPRWALACVLTLGLSAMRFVHAGDWETLQGSWVVLDARIRLDSAPAAPSTRRIYLAGDSGFTLAGIYRITGDTLRVALPIEHWNDRPIPPAGFGAPNTETLILTRAKRY